MNNQGIGSWITRRARLTPWKTALIDNNSLWTYSEFSKRITRLAHGFRSLGIHKGDRIAYLNLNHSTYLETFFASGMIGAIFVPLNIRLLPANLEYILDQTGCKILIYGPEAKNIVDRFISTSLIPRYISIKEDNLNNLTLNALIADQPDSPLDEFVTLDEIALISFTSGTTGRPKGVMLSHNNLSWNVFNLMSCTDILSDDKILVNAPLNRMGALGVTVLPGIFKGATLIISADKEIKKIVELIENHKITVLFGGPDFFHLLDKFSNEKKVDFSSIRFCIVGGDVVQPALVQRWLKRGIQFQQGYGLTEAAPVALLLDREELLSKNGSAGRPMFFTDVRVVSQDLMDAEPGRSGEVILKGPNITNGYWEDAAKTNKRLMSSGWLHSGDAARIDEDNHIYILGRLKDGIKLQNRIVYPSEIETMIGEQPEVTECAVIGVPGEKTDHIVIFVVLEKNNTHSEEDLLKLWTEKLAPVFIPNYVKIVESLPKNANGKIIRQQLRELFLNSEVST